MLIRMRRMTVDSVFLFAMTMFAIAVGIGLLALIVMAFMVVKGL